MFIITIGNKAITVVAGSTVAATVATTIYDAVVDAIATGNYPEFAELSWDNDTSAVITATGPAGVPFTAVGTTTETGGGAADAQTFVNASTNSLTSSPIGSGPNWASVAANWSGGAVPVSGDLVIIADSEIDILYGLTALTSPGVELLTGSRIDASYTGRIGLPLINENGYEEYRDRYFQMGMAANATIFIGQGPGQGSSRIYLDYEIADALTIRVFSTGQPESPDDEALRIICVDAANVIEMTQGSVGLAREPGQVSTVATVKVEPLDPQSDATFRAGSGCTLATLIANGGTIETDCALTTVTLMAGVWTHTGGAIGAGGITNTAGTIIDLSNGAITFYIGREERVYDHRGDFRAKTYTAVDLYPGATWLDPNAAANTYTAGIDLNQGRLEEFTIDVGPNRRITPGTVA